MHFCFCFFIELDQIYSLKMTNVAIHRGPVGFGNWSFSRIIVIDLKWNIIAAI